MTQLFLDEIYTSEPGSPTADIDRGHGLFVVGISLQELREKVGADLAEQVDAKSAAKPSKR